MASTVQETMSAINSALSKSEYRCQTVSWDDVERGTVNGSLSSLGPNITDTRLYEKSGKLLYTVRTQNWNEKLGAVDASGIALMAGGVQEGSPPKPVTLADFLKNIGQHGSYAGMARATQLNDKAMDAKVSIRFQTTFLPVPDEQLGALEFAPEMYNYQTRSDEDPKNLLILATTQGSAIQQDGAGAKKLFHHAVDPKGGKGEVCRYWFEAERSAHKVGGAQKETDEEKADALKRGKAIAAVLGTKAMGTRFNVLMTIQVPLEQSKQPAYRGSMAMAKGGMLKKSCGGGGGGGGGGGASLSLSAASLSAAPLSMMMQTKSMMMDSVEDAMGCSSEEDELMSADELLSAGAITMGVDADEDDLLAELEALEGESLSSSVAMPTASMALPTGAVKSKKMGRSMPARKPPPKRGTANAARVSRGSMHDKWRGLALAAPKRDKTQHVTVTCVIYNTVAGGVPSVEDVQAAVDDMEELYRACGWTGKLASDGANFMKSELTVGAVADIAKKVVTQPYAPESAAPVGGDVFPSSASGDGGGAVLEGQPVKKCSVM